MEVLVFSGLQSTLTVDKQLHLTFFRPFSPSSPRFQNTPLKALIGGGGEGALVSSLSLFPVHPTSALDKKAATAERLFEFETGDKTKRATPKWGGT